jgi:dnd system-associated protein 4
MSDTDYTRTDRVYIDESVIEFYRQLKKEGNSEPEQAPFDTFKDLFMFAACLGFQTDRRTKPRKGGNGGEVPTKVFSENDLAILKAIAIADTDDIEVLGRPGEIYGIAEEYANTGIHEVKADLLDEQGRPLWNLVNLLNENAT